MKKEIFGINKSDVRIYGLQNGLKPFLSIYWKARSVGFLGLTYSGKDLLVRILSGKEAEEIQNHKYLYRGEEIESCGELEKMVYRVASF